MTEDEARRTVQIGLRLDSELLDRIDWLAAFEQIDRMGWIKRALANSVRDANTRWKDHIIDSYLQLRFNDDEYKHWMGVDSIPEDLQQARRLRLQKIATEDL